VLTVYGIET